VLDIDWQLVLSQSDLHSQLVSMQAAIAANDRAQHELRDAALCRQPSSSTLPRSRRPTHLTAIFVVDVQIASSAVSTCARKSARGTDARGIMRGVE